MKMKALSGSSLFLIECIIVVFVLALASATAAGFFVQAHRLAEESSDLTKGALIAQTLAEEIRSGQQKTGEFFFNQKGVAAENGTYRSVVSVAKEEGLATYRILVYHAQSEIYSLTLKQYEGGEVLDS